MSKLLTTKQVAEIFNCAPQTIFRRAKSGEIPVVRLGGLVRFRSEDIEALIQTSAMVEHV